METTPPTSVLLSWISYMLRGSSQIHTPLSGKKRKPYRAYAFFLFICFTAWTIPHLSAADEAPALVIAGPSFLDQGQRGSFVVSIETSGSINAFEGAIMLPFPGLRILAVRDAGTLASFWITPPHETASGTVSFVGVIAGGGKGTLPLFAIDVESGGEYLANVRGSGTGAYNDGNGTIVPLVFSVRSDSVAAVPSEEDIRNDLVPPEPFEIFISHDQDLFEGHEAVTFGTRDAGGSGIAYYEAQEHWKPLPSEDGWRRMVSPYKLRHAPWTRFISIKAVDYNGNAQITTQRLTASFTARAIYSGMFAMLLVAAICSFLIRRRNRQRRSS
jgi:hypothetical protein